LKSVLESNRMLSPLNFVASYQPLCDRLQIGVYAEVLPATGGGDLRDIDSAPVSRGCAGKLPSPELHRLAHMASAND